VFVWCSRAPKRAPLFDITVYEKRPQRAIAAENEKERLRRLAEADALRKVSTLFSIPNEFLSLLVFYWCLNVM
jgi:hypothetical protein